MDVQTIIVDDVNTQNFELEQVGGHGSLVFHNIMNFGQSGLTYKKVNDYFASKFKPA